MRGGIQIRRYREEHKPAAYPPQLTLRKRFSDGVIYAKGLTHQERETLKRDISARGRRTSWYNYAKRSVMHPGDIIKVYDGPTGAGEPPSQFKLSVIVEHPLLAAYTIYCNGTKIFGVTNISNLAAGRIERQDQALVYYPFGQIDIEIINTAGKKYFYERVAYHEIPAAPPIELIELITEEVSMYISGIELSETITQSVLLAIAGIELTQTIQESIETQLSQEKVQQITQTVEVTLL